MSQGKRIVLTTYGTLGDLHPYLAIALELEARGHTPVIATSEYHRKTTEGAGLAFTPIRPDISFEDRELHRQLTEPKRGMERVIRELMLPVLKHTYDDLLDVVQEDGGADLLISQILIFAAPLIAEKTGVRWLSTELQPGAFMSAYDPPVLAAVPSLARLRPLGSKFHRPLFRFAKLTARSWSNPIRQLRRDVGLAPGSDPLFAGRNSPHLVLALFSNLIGCPQPDWPPNTLVTGFAFYDDCRWRPETRLMKFLDEGEPPIVFTLGSSAVWNAGDFYSQSVEVAQSLGKRAVLLIGRDPANQSREELPANVIAVPYAPFAQLFPYASAIVHQGGIGTTAQALRAGKPMLVVPFGSDQFDNGARIERLGAGRTIPRNRDRVAPAAKELKHLLENTSYSDAAASIARSVQEEDGVRRACDAIEQQLES